VRSRLVVLTRSAQVFVGVLSKDAGRPDKVEERDGDGEREGVEQVKVSLVDGEVAGVAIGELGNSEDASNEVGHAGEEEDEVERRPSVQEPLSRRRVTRGPDHMTGSAVGARFEAMLVRCRHRCFERGQTHVLNPNQIVSMVNNAKETT